MNPILSAVLGAVAVASAYGISMAVRKTWRLMEGLAAGSRAASDLAGTMRELLQTGKEIAAAVQTLNLALTGGYVQPAAQVASTEKQRQPLPPFPGAPPVYPVSYEASLEETDIVSTTDEELAELERVDEIRDKGFSVENDESVVSQPPGVTKDATL